MMGRVNGFALSWSGFVDYWGMYSEVHLFWIIGGVALVIGTSLSVVPQLYRIVRLRSCVGVSPLFVLITSIGQILVVMNMFCLNNAQFTGTLQISPSRTLPAFLSFGISFGLWLTYLPVCNMIITFYQHGPSWFGTIAIAAATVLSEMLLMIIYFVVACFAGTGFSSDHLQYLGMVFGMAAAVVTVIQYIPQFITTCKLKDNGSFSLVMLAIQAPGGTMNMFLMAFGNGQHWSTWGSLAVSSVQQFSMLALCIFYKCRARAKKELPDRSLSASLTGPKKDFDYKYMNVT
jgi:uncharacterized protein with PQ loop repeat